MGWPEVAQEVIAARGGSSATLPPLRFEQEEIIERARDRRWIVGVDRH
jgi:hypothetical protein